MTKDRDKHRPKEKHRAVAVGESGRADATQANAAQADATHAAARHAAEVARRAASAAAIAALPDNRASLLALHREARARRAAAPLGGEAYRDACEALERIEVRIAGIERAMVPPLG